MVTSINYTSCEISNDGEWYFYTIYSVLAVVSSLVGDTLILVGTIKYKAIQLHRFIVTLIQHIAVCDLIVAVALILPNAVSLVAESWIFGNVMCYVRMFILWQCMPASVLLVCTLTSSKLAMMLYPLRARAWSKEKAHVLAGINWALSLIWILLFLLVDKDDVYFDPRVCDCYYGFSSGVWKWLQPAIMMSMWVMPQIIVIVCAVWILVVAWKVTKQGPSSLQWQGVVTILLTAGIYCISILPGTSYFMLAEFVVEDPPGPFHLQYYRFGQYVLYLNTISNFYVYIFTVRRFREFLRARLQAVALHLNLRRPNLAPQRGKVAPARKCETTTTTTREQTTTTDL